jgi:hypothetical protein
MGSGVKGQGVGALLTGRVPGPSFAIRGRRVNDAIHRGPAAGPILTMEPSFMPANSGLGLERVGWRRGLCSVWPAATEARTEGGTHGYA